VTEQEWFETTEATALLKHLQGRVTDRKMRLLACAACQRIWHWIPPKIQAAIARLEQIAGDYTAKAEILKLRVIGREAERVDPANAVQWAAALAGQYATEATSHSETSVSCISFAAEAVGLSAAQKDRSRISVAFDIARGREARAQCLLIRDIFGDPFHPVTFRPAWRTATVTSLAEAIYADRAFDRLPILADALEDAGCTSAEVLEHCRGPGPHARGCWVVDLVLGKS